MRTMLVTTIPLLFALACTATPASPGAEDTRQQVLDASGTTDTVHISLGEDIRIESKQLTLRFEEVLADSRCPLDVTCVWEGSLRVRLSIEPTGADPSELTLESSDAGGGASSGDVGEHRVTLLQVVAPAPGAEGRYRIALEVGGR